MLITDCATKNGDKNGDHTVTYVIEVVTNIAIDINSKRPQ